MKNTKAEFKAIIENLLPMDAMLFVAECNGMDKMKSTRIEKSLARTSKMVNEVVEGNEELTEEFVADMFFRMEREIKIITGYVLKGCEICRLMTEDYFKLSGFEIGTDLQAGNKVSEETLVNTNKSLCGHLEGTIKRVILQKCKIEFMNQAINIDGIVEIER